MTTKSLKKHIHETVESINDVVLLEAVYTLLNKASQSIKGYDWDENDIKIVEDRKAKYKSGKLKAMSLIELNKKIQKKLILTTILKKESQF